MIKQKTSTLVELKNNLPREIGGVSLILLLSIGLLGFYCINETKFRAVHSKISNVRISSKGLIELRDSLELTRSKSIKFNALIKSNGYPECDFQTTTGIMEYCEIMGIDLPVDFPLTRVGAKYYIKSKSYFHYPQSI